ncbi:MAG: GNAT family N-acetyltransferase [Trueperaceae bacterium]
MDIIVREAAPKDAQGILNVLNPIIETKKCSVMVKAFTLEEEISFIKNFPERGIFHVALNEDNINKDNVHEDKIVGFQVVEPFSTLTAAFDHVGIIGTYINLMLRGQGIAKKLFEATFAKAKAKGFEKITAYVRADNPIALKTYEAHGFTRIGVAKRQANIDGNYVDEVFIETFL